MVSIAASLTHTVTESAATVKNTASGVSVPGHRANAREGITARSSAANIRGLTLIELVITMTVVGVVAALAAPAFDRLMRKVRLDSATDLLYAQIVSMRTEAIKRGSTVIMCKTGDPLDLADGNDTPTCGNNIYPSGASLPSNNWSYGWLTYTTDPSFYGERNYTPGSGDVLIGTSDPHFQDNGVDITSNNAGNQWLTFQGDGSLNETGTVLYAICDDRGVDSGRLITIFLDGEARIDDLPTTLVTSCTPPNT